MWVCELGGVLEVCSNPFLWQVQGSCPGNNSGQGFLAWKEVCCGIVGRKGEGWVWGLPIMGFRALPGLSGVSGCFGGSHVDVQASPPFPGSLFQWGTERGVKAWSCSELGWQISL